MTYAGLFEKCKTVVETRELKNKLISELEPAFKNFNKLMIEQAYKNRVWEIRDEKQSAKPI